ncbi:Uncharacterized protein CTA2_47 [Colletotrichum tanaceti]|uniref:Membrane protein C24H6.13 n=1 Tax=Colletotrichum tanaceti TaxID=1306861 RepID=A0A4U6XL45_9PEZI|nr:Uncharacterized protein CTA2_82 [Colletotrichum tanaceti]KAJ0169026.1 Uncharacterized protein CTA2_47 [Colletotrichum tanaceti]TKW56334.1 uncharacterized protein CTA1_1795 [Colletotrichum tanaceti]
MSTTPTATPSDSASLTETLASSLASSLSTALSATISATLSSNGTISSSATTTPSETPPPAPTSAVPLPSDRYQGITLVAFLTALATGLSIFAVQIIAFLLLRNKIARIFKPKSYLVPERERTESPPSRPWSLISTLIHYDDRDIIKKCGLDAYFFLRYLRTLLTIFIPIAVIVIPILIPLNYSDGVGHDLIDDAKNETTNGTSSDPVRLMTRAGQSASGDNDNEPTGLDTLAWGNISKTHTGRFWAHLILALLVIIWVCTVFFFELRVYIKVRQDYLTSAEHRLRASATTILVNSIPSKWLTEEALLGLFDVFPGQIRNIWLNRDLTTLLEKIQLRESIHLRLEAAETELVKAAKRKQLKRKKKEDKLSRKQANTKGPTRQEEALRRQREDADAKKRAEAGLGISSGEHEDVPHDISAIIDDKHKNPESRRSSTSSSSSDNGNRPESRGFGLGLIGDGISKVGKGLLGGVGKAQQNIREFSDDVEETVETTNGFAMLHPSDRPRKVQILAEDERPATAESARVTADQAEPQANTETQKTHYRNASAVSQETSDQNYKRSYEPLGNGNTVRKVSNLDHMYDQEKRKFWQFWKNPAGGYASPVPQGFDGGEYPFGQSKDKTTWQKIKAYIPFTGGDSHAPVEYPESNTIGGEYKNILDDDAEWRKWIKEKNRPMHRLPRWGFPDWLAWLTFGPKVDTIYWCRSELARLNVEIDDDQAHPERYPLMNSAFIQFNHQVSAHMACQSLMHHVPKHMSPRINEVSPKDVIWDNMALKWWHESIRSGVVTVIIAAMAFFWAIPIAFTASIANIDGLVGQFPWLAWIKKEPVEKVAGAVAGVLPAILLALLLLIVPLILEQLALFRGVKTGSQKAEFVQRFYFVFLFIQVFLVVSVASFFAASVDELWANLETLSNVGEILNILARNLPRASNYFFSYMLLQALSVSSGTLLQIGGLVTWYLLARILDTTARDKWKRNTTLSTIAWGQFFPVYTNFACIALVYSVIAPLISLFAVLTFGLLWFAQRYSMLYVTRFETDTGGVLYPRAINQTFTGLYVMEACLAGLFFITVDENDNSAATPQGVIMLVTLGLTAIFQISLNTSFSPLFRYLPITVEDEAVLRDEAFQRAQNRRLGLPNDDGDEFTDEKTPMANGDGSGVETPGIELQRMENEGPKRKPSTMRRVKNVGHWAKREGKNLRSKTWNVSAAPVHTAAEYRRQQRNKDLEAQRALGEALYGGFHDEIEDLTPAERDALVKNAFKHYALRARAPAVWIPRDDIGVSDDEIRRTKDYSEHIWISNEGTALDSKIRVVYGANPPDFSEIDIINL